MPYLQNDFIALSEPGFGYGNQVLGLGSGAWDKRWSIAHNLLLPLCRFVVSPPFCFSDSEPIWKYTWRNFDLVREIFTLGVPCKVRLPVIKSTIRGSEGVRCTADESHWGREWIPGNLCWRWEIWVELDWWLWGKKGEWLALQSPILLPDFEADWILRQDGEGFL